MIDQFQQTDNDRDLEFLKNFRPEWENDRVEPLTPPPEDSVVPPTWQKIDLTLPFVLEQRGRGGGSDFNPELVQAVIGVQDGFGGFVPKLGFVIGPLTDP